MKRFFGKFGFIHRRLWRQDARYRAALLFGPAPLLGALLAAASWGGMLAIQAMTYQPPAWAQPQGPQYWNTGAGQPQTVQPYTTLPPLGVNGIPVGYEPGWRASTNPIEVSGTMDVDVKATTLTGFNVGGPTVDMAQIIAAGPKTGLYVGEAQGSLVVKTAGVYALTLRVERAASSPADCLLRLGFGPHRILSNLEAIGGGTSVAKTYEAARFDLQPGLYRIAWLFGCWRDHEVIAPGRMTVLIGHPGEPGLLPARADDVVR